MGASELTKNLKTAFEYKRNGSYKQAIDYFYKALAIENDSAEIMTELAFLYSKLCRYDRAVSFYEQILQKDPENNNAKFELAVLLKILKDYRRAEKLLLELYNAGYNIEKTAGELFYILLCTKKYGKIIASFNKYSSELKNSSVLYYTALAYSALGSRYTAGEYFRKSFQNDEKNILPGIEIANGFFERGQKEEARNLALKLLKYAEDDRICSLLAEIEYSGGNIDNAVKYYSYAVKINPQKAVYYYKLALSFSLKGFFKEAEESFCRAINLDGANEEYNYALAYMYYVTGKYDLAAKIDDFLLEINPDNIKAVSLKVLLSAENNNNQFLHNLVEKLEKARNKDDFTYYALSIYYAKLNLWSKAADAVSEALRINKNSAEYNYQLAVFYYKLGRTKEAEVIIEMLLRNNPKYIQALILLSKIHRLNKNFSKALEILDKVVELDRNISEAYEVQASIYFAQKNYEKAAELYKTALSISPDKEEYYAKTAECYFKLENYSDAYFYYKEAAEFNITKAEYRYYAAKCAELTGDEKNAASNYSLAKRLSPNNFIYIRDYAAFLAKTGRKNDAKKMLKSIKKYLDAEDSGEVSKMLKKM